MTVLCASGKVGGTLLGLGSPGRDERLCLLRCDPLGPWDGEALLTGSLLGLNLFREPLNKSSLKGSLGKKKYTHTGSSGGLSRGHTGIKYLPGIIVPWNIILHLARNDHRNGGWLTEASRTMLLGFESGSVI